MGAKGILFTLCSLFNASNTEPVFCSNSIPLAASQEWVGLRVLDKITAIVDRHMEDVNAQRCQLPLLTSASLWKKSGRWSKLGEELLRMTDRKNVDYCLAPTHEEAITELVGREISSYKHLPIRLYQIERKFRDELRPRHGLVRTREFLMKDLYTFDIDYETAAKTYAEVQRAYDRIFVDLKLKVVVAAADPGAMGGSMSHEYVIDTEEGEDEVMICDQCGYSANVEVHPERYRVNCPEKGCPNVGVKIVKGMEVGHSFILGDTYSDPFKCQVSDDTNTLQTVSMGCYGLGLSRIMSAIASEHSDGKALFIENQQPIAVAIIPAQHSHFALAVDLADRLAQVSQLSGEVVLDDRSNTRLGNRLTEAELVGYPFVVVVGRDAASGKVELHRRQHGSSDVIGINQLCEAVLSS